MSRLEQDFTNEALDHLSRYSALAALNLISKSDAIKQADKVKNEVEKKVNAGLEETIAQLLFYKKFDDAKRQIPQGIESYYPFIYPLALAIIASGGSKDPKYQENQRQTLERVKAILSDDRVQDITGFNKQAAMVWALYDVPVNNVEILESLCSIVENGYSESTADAVGALRVYDKLHNCDPVLTNQAAKVLANFIANSRNYDWLNTSRKRALVGLRKLKVDKSSEIMSELMDYSPTIVCEAARALESMLGTKIATARVVEQACKSESKIYIELYADALRWMVDQTAVVDKLESYLMSGSSSDEEQAAHALLTELGGAVAFQKLRARTDAMKKYSDAMAAAEGQLQTTFETTIKDAQHGFRYAVYMDFIVFVLGILLLAASAGLALANGGTLDNWAGVGTTGVAGVMGVVYGVFIAKPRKKIAAAADHLMKLKIIFLAYLRQLHEADGAYMSHMAEGLPMDPDEMAKFSTLIGKTMEDAISRLSTKNGDDSEEETDTPTPKKGKQQNSDDTLAKNGTDSKPKTS